MKIKNFKRLEKEGAGGKGVQRQAFKGSYVGEEVLTNGKLPLGE